MTNSQRLTVRASEIRERLNVIAAMEGDALTDEVRAEESTLGTEYRDVETKLRAATIAEGDPNETRDTAVTPEQRERAELRGRARLHRFISAAIHDRSPDGAEAEYAESAGCPGLVPLALFGPTAEERAAEFRAAAELRAVTPAPADSDVTTTHAAIVPALFDRSVAGQLGIEMMSVPTGIRSFPVLATSLTGGPRAESAAAAETAGSFTVTDADPRRIAGSFKILREDIAKMADLEDALNMNLSAVLSDEFDKQVVNGDNAAPNLNGILEQLTDPSAPAASAEDFGRYAAAFGSHIDGLFAVTPGDVRALVGPKTLQHMVSVFGGANSDRSAYSYLSQEFGGVRASRRIPDPSGNIQQAIIRRANPAGDRVAAAPVWSGVELIRDPYTGAGKGEIIVTGTVLVGGVVLLRSGAFVQDSFRLA